MKWLTLTAALFVCSVGTNAADAGLLDLFDGMDVLNLNGHDGCCCPAPKCCAPKPVCCKPAPRCCAPKPVCCAPKPVCCAPKPVCCAPKPVCCKPAPPTCCDPCCKKGLLDDLFGGGHDLFGGLFGHGGCGCGH